MAITVRIMGCLFSPPHHKGRMGMKLTRYVREIVILFPLFAAGVFLGWSIAAMALGLTP